MINVVHICASDILGGAARAAYRLHKSFSESRLVTSHMLVRSKAGDDESVIRYAPPRFSPRYLYATEIWRRYSDSRWSGFVTANPVVHSRADIRSGLLAGLNGIPCNIVHLHWLGTGTLSVEEIGQIGKPVVWTLHDMWTFCGAEHYAPDERDARFRSGYLPSNRTEGEGGPDMNRNVWLRKRRAWKRPMTLVCPSQWMADCARQSVLCGSWPVACIPNPLDLERWRPFDQKMSRELLGLPRNGHIVLFGAIGGEQDPRKGANLLRQIFQELKGLGITAHLVVFGQSRPGNGAPFDFPVTYLGRLHDDFSMIATYSAADVMLVPSRLDNLPQTAVEAQACGVPVVAFEIGGLTDIVKDQETGFLVPPFDISAFAKRVAQILGDGENRQKMVQVARSSALEKFASPVVANAYVDLYANVLTGREC